MKKVVPVIVFMLLACATCVGQTSYKGLTPGRSTRADAERVLGRPVKEVSRTLVEYESPESAGKLFVQYRDGSPAGVVERIEMTCLNKCGPGTAYDQFSRSAGIDGEADVRVREGSKATAYFGAPRFLRLVEHWKGDEAEYRVALFSPELYENALPQGGCTGTIFGTWDTDPSLNSTDRYLDLGRVKIERVGENGIKGSYQKNNGTFTLKLDGPEPQNFLYGHSKYKGEWKDDKRGGTVEMEVRDNNSIRARFNRTSGGIPQKPTASKSSDDARTPYDDPTGRYLLPNWYGKCAP